MLGGKQRPQQLSTKEFNLPWCGYFHPPSSEPAHALGVKSDREYLYFVRFTEVVSHRGDPCSTASSSPRIKGHSVATAVAAVPETNKRCWPGVISSRRSMDKAKSTCLDKPSSDELNVAPPILSDHDGKNRSPEVTKVAQIGDYKRNYIRGKGPVAVYL